MNAGGAGERGSATVWVLALSTVLATIGLAVVLVGAAVVARHRATAAADLAALAGAVRAVRGDPGACDTAAEVATANSAERQSCSQGVGLAGGLVAPAPAARHRRPPA